MWQVSVFNYYRKMSSANTARIIYKWRVRSGFLGIILAVILSQPNPYSILGGTIITLAGLMMRTWACGYLRKEKELTISGPYRYTRNPLYFGNLILGIGIVVGSYSLWMLFIFSVYFLVFYPVVISQEKSRLKDLFPKEYEEFGQKVPLFFPSLKPSIPSMGSTFSWKLYRRNRESRALYGAIIFWTIIVGKMTLF